jgi:hypothetical protein
MLPSGNNFYKKKDDILSGCHLKIITVNKYDILSCCHLEILTIKIYGNYFQMAT